jgi:hypothetical protein
VHVSERFVAEALGVTRLHLPSPFTVRDAFISAAAVQLRMSLRDRRPPSAAFAEAIATVIAYRVGVEAQSSAGLGASARAQELLRGSNQPITQIALDVGMTHSHFIRSFLKRFGVSPREFRQQVQR